ncbi:MAG: MFS transporter, partial [Dehalococcoidia bacterium]
LTLAGAFIFSLFVLTFAVSPSYWLSVALIFLGGLFNSIFLISSMTALQMKVPDSLRGRVMGIHSITFSLIPLGGMMGGAVAQAMNERFAVGISAVVLAVIIVLVTLTQREVRDMDGRTLRESVVVE